MHLLSSFCEAIPNTNSLHRPKCGGIDWRSARLVSAGLWSLDIGRGGAVSDWGGSGTETDSRG